MKKARANNYILYDSTCMAFPEKKILETEKQSGWLEVGARTDCKHVQEKFGGLMKMDCDNCCRILYLQKPIHYLQWVNFIVYKLYLNEEN